MNSIPSKAVEGTLLFSLVDKVIRDIMQQEMLDLLLMMSIMYLTWSKKFIRAQNARKGRLAVVDEAIKDTCELPNE